MIRMTARFASWMSVHAAGEGNEPTLKAREDMTRSRLVLAFGLLIWVALGAPALAQQPLHLVLPTSNDALLHGDGAGFYMYTDRNFKGQRSQPWEGGQYGYVRNAKETPQGIVYTRFHEGVDIKPLYRDASGEPLDSVRTIDDGYVVYVNNIEAQSSYGKYVVVEHWWSGAPFYSLYAHLKAVHVRRGEQVVQGQRLGLLGHTGPGLDRRRAHLHFEVNMLLHQNFGRWHSQYFRGANVHDVFNGINLAGLDVASLYLALHRDPSLTIEKFLAQQEPFYTAAVPNEGPIDLMYRYPFLVSQRHPWIGQDGGLARVASWEISFSQSGLPLRIEPSARRVREATVVSAKPTDFAYAYLTSGTLSGSGPNVSLSNSGARYLRLLTLPTERNDYIAWPAAVEAEAAAPPVRTVELERPAETPPRPSTERLSPEEAARRVSDELKARQARPEPAAEARDQRVRGW